MNEFSKNIKELRIKRGLSQQEVAEAIGMTRAAVGNYEQGIREPSFDVLSAFAKFFNVNVSELLGYETGLDFYKDLFTQMFGAEVVEAAINGEIKKPEQMSEEEKRKANEEAFMEYISGLTSAEKIYLAKKIMDTIK